ncbi:antimicrobial peptides [Setaria italica]|uniref:antimicrobial peptides n=1 Tax=Setaria italica TaxID=4555 RepID=UPI000646FF30|nr:antimicrobial peptides [Setaria italica]
MGFGRKVGEGGVSRWLLLLAGVLLAVAVTVTAGDAAEEGATAGDYSLHGSQAMCELKCQHHHDPVNKKRCVDFCIRWQLALPFDAAEEGATAGEDSLHGSRAMCELKCQHHHDPVNKKRCVDFCIRWQLALPFDAVEEGATAGKDSLHGSRAMCELKCQHHHDPVNKKRCVDFCIRWQLALLFDVKEEDGASATDTITAGEVGVCANRRICKIKCQHHHDQVNSNRCTDFCIGYQVALDAIMENGATATVTAGEDTLRGSRRTCELKCQHHHNPVNKKRCVDFCIRYQLALHDINDGTTAAAAGGAIRQVV